MSAAAADLQATLARLEGLRRASLVRILVLLGVIPLATLAAMAYFVRAANEIGLFASLGIGLVATIIVPMRMLGRVKARFKAEIMPLLLAGIDGSLRYTAKGGISRDEFVAPELFIRPDSYTGTDLVTGRIGDTAVRFSLVHAQERYEEQSTDSDGKSQTQTRYRTIFRGLFLIADFNKHFAGRTLVKPQAVGFFSRLFGSHVALEDPEFNKLFTVHSTDQVEARYILTPSLMERLKSMRSRVGAFRAAFFRGNLYVAIDMPLDAFEPAVLRSLERSGQVGRIVANLRSVTGVVEDLGLNTRIWSKVAQAA